MSEIVVDVQNVSLLYNLSRKKEQRLKEYVINMLKGELFFDEFWALKEISFQLKKGESLGIIGTNGSGKSTLLKLVAGLMPPTKGSIATQGNIAPLIELGGGFDRDLTAKENIHLMGAMHGHSKKFMEKRVNSIIEFAELQDFADTPIRNYSSGMSARLAFSIATLVKPDILIADEVLSVGDSRFQKKCAHRMQEMRRGGTSVLFVSHSSQQVQNICEKVLWIEKGQVKDFGPASIICAAYENFLKQ